MGENLRSNALPIERRFGFLSSPVAETRPSGRRESRTFDWPPRTSSRRTASIVLRGWRSRLSPSRARDATSFGVLDDTAGRQWPLRGAEIASTKDSNWSTCAGTPQPAEDANAAHSGRLPMEYQACGLTSDAEDACRPEADVNERPVAEQRVWATMFLEPPERGKAPRVRGR